MLMNKIRWGSGNGDKASSKSDFSGRLRKKTVCEPATTPIDIPRHPDPHTEAMSQSFKKKEVRKRPDFRRVLLVLGMTLTGLFSSMCFASWSMASDALTTLSPDQIDQTAIVDDPLEDVNRSVFRFNRDVDQYIIKPVAEGYKAILPQPMRESIHSFLSNLGAPVVFFNDVLQLDGDRAMDTLARFLINTTLGLGGIFDPAAEVFEINHHVEDFGGTLGTYGVGGDPYIILPILGPSNPRDMVGMIVDILADPVDYIAHARTHHADDLTYARFGVEATEKRVEADEVLRRIDKALDPYVLMRSIYTQNREFNIRKGVIDLESPTPNTEELP